MTHIGTYTVECDDARTVWVVRDKNGSEVYRTTKPGIAANWCIKQVTREVEAKR